MLGNNQPSLLDLALFFDAEITMRVRSRIPIFVWKRLRPILARVIGICACVALLFNLNSLRTELLLLRSDSVVVEIHSLEAGVGPKFYQLSKSNMQEFFAILRRNSIACYSREFASSYVIRVYLKDARDRCCGEIWIQPSIRMTNDTQMKTLIEAASTGTPVTDEAILFARNCDSVVCRSCDK